MWAHTPILTPEKKVWRAVLTQAFEDAEMAADEDETAPETFECSRAREYLRGDNLQEMEHLKLVCEYAEIPADRVMSWARRRYRQEHFNQSTSECGGAAAAFLASEAVETPEKREICPRAAQQPAPVKAVVSEVPALLPD